MCARARVSERRVGVAEQLKRSGSWSLDICHKSRGPDCAVLVGPHAGISCDDTRLPNSDESPRRDSRIRANVGDGDSDDPRRGTRCGMENAKMRWCWCVFRGRTISRVSRSRWKLGRRGSARVLLIEASGCTMWCVGDARGGASRSGRRCCRNCAHIYICLRGNSQIARSVAQVRFPAFGSAQREVLPSFWQLLPHSRVFCRVPPSQRQTRSWADSPKRTWPSACRPAGRRCAAKGGLVKPGRCTAPLSFSSSFLFLSLPDHSHKNLVDIDTGTAGRRSAEA